MEHARTPNTPNTARGAFSLREAAEYLGISFSGLNRLIPAGKICVRALGKRRLIARTDLDQFISGLPSAER